MSANIQTVRRYTVGGSDRYTFDWTPARPDYFRCDVQNAPIFPVCCPSDMRCCYDMKRFAIDYVGSCRNGLHQDIVIIITV